ncbi:probable pectin methylesterase CGR3 [Camellia sinensis]|uniref:probable pectin methylesterase CGR3 n=1 Tax=Camellia sinensis TaxID=4442 RepID=UPI001036C947|nr:probable pectin methylesterase CGR3 [Camellia sinensis]
MSRRPSRRLADGGNISFISSLHSKTSSSPLLSLGLVVVGSFLVIGYLYSGSGGSRSDIEAASKLEGEYLLLLSIVWYIRMHNLELYHFVLHLERSEEFDWS